MSHCPSCGQRGVFDCERCELFLCDTCEQWVPWDNNAALALSSTCDKCWNDCVCGGTGYVSYGDGQPDQDCPSCSEKGCGQ